MPTATKEKVLKGIAITTPRIVTFEMIENAICGALEGGSNYWYNIEDQKVPKNFNNSREDMAKYHHISYPMNEGGHLMIKDTEDREEKIYKLDLESIKKGIQSMAKDDPRHLDNLLNENDDAETHDVFLQHCVLGKCIYG